MISIRRKIIAEKMPILFTVYQGSKAGRVNLIYIVPEPIFERFGQGESCNSLCNFSKTITKVFDMYHTKKGYYNFALYQYLKNF